MNYLALFCVLALATTSLASRGPFHEWEDWKKETYQKALNSPTSFLNAFSLEQVSKGAGLFLVLDPQRKNTRWVKEQPKDFYAQAEHLGKSIRVQVRGKTMVYLKDEPKKRRKDFTLPNGAVAEVVFGKRNQKLWTYLYDPDQIKIFTGFKFYPFNTSAIVKGVFKRQERQFVSYKTVQGDSTQVHKIGNVSFELNNKAFFLPAYNWQKNNEKLNYIALVFTDNSKGKDTYAGGRELVIPIEGNLDDQKKLSIDFNRTLNFYCAHSPFWHCPVGLQKHLDTVVKAGEMLPEKKIVN